MSIAIEDQPLPDRYKLISPALRGSSETMIAWLSSEAEFGGMAKLGLFTELRLLDRYIYIITDKKLMIL
jgi:hypothetical protein